MEVTWLGFFIGTWFLVFRGGLSLLWLQFECPITKKAVHGWKFALMTIFPIYPDLVCFAYLSINNFIKLINGKYHAGSFHGLCNHWFVILMAAAIAPRLVGAFERYSLLPFLIIVNLLCRAVARSVPNRATNGGFAVKQQQQVKVVTKQRPQTLDSLFANMKEQRMKVLSQQNNAGRRNGAGQQRPRPPWGRYNN